jgi:ArsR family transcriptional regulator
MSMPARDRHALKVAKALADPTRWRLLRAIAAADEISCADLVTLAGLSQATVSHHLKILAEAGLISVRRSGPFHYHRAVAGAVEAHGAALAAALAPPSRRPRPKPSSRCPTPPKESTP